MKYFGIGKEKGMFGKGYNINILLGNIMYKLILRTERTQKAKLYFYDKDELEFLARHEMLTFKWFIGVVVNND